MSFAWDECYLPTVRWGAGEMKERQHLNGVVRELKKRIEELEEYDEESVKACILQTDLLY